MPLLMTAACVPWGPSHARAGNAVIHIDYNEIWRVLTDVGNGTLGQGVPGGTHWWCAACVGIEPFLGEKEGWLVLVWEGPNPLNPAWGHAPEEGEGGGVRFLFGFWGRFRISGFILSILNTRKGVKHPVPVSGAHQQ